MATSTPEFHLALSALGRLERSDDAFHIFAHGRQLRVRAPGVALAGALRRLAAGGATEEALCEEVMQSGEASALFSLAGVLRALDASGALQRRVLVEGRRFATLTPAAGGFRFAADRPLSEGRHKLSRFAYLRAERGALRVESPLGRARLELHDPQAAAATVALASPCSLRDLEALFPDLGNGALEGLLILLDNAAALVDPDRPEGAERPADGGPASGWWEFHDLLFHMRSRRGRHDAPYGGTYRGGGLTPPPLVKPLPPGAVSIPLARPDLERLRRDDPPFADVVERRRSARAYGSKSLTVDQLGEFLYRSARYQRVLPGKETEYAHRAAPAGGALHELEVYPVVASCRGLDPGVYHYRPAEHALTRVAEPSPLFERLLAEAHRTANQESPLQVYFQITARCQRVYWKYESMAYALVLKNLGALYATMYLAATAMGLAPCALGGGDSELFATIAALDPVGEPTVGEFVLGTQAEG